MLVRGGEFCEIFVGLYLFILQNVGLGHKCNATLSPSLGHQHLKVWHVEICHM